MPCGDWVASLPPLRAIWGSRAIALPPARWWGLEAGLDRDRDRAAHYRALEPAPELHTDRGFSSRAGEVRSDNEPGFANALARSARTLNDARAAEGPRGPSSHRRETGPGGVRRSCGSNRTGDRTADRDHGNQDLSSHNQLLEILAPERRDNSHESIALHTFYYGSAARFFLDTAPSKFTIRTQSRYHKPVMRKTLCEYHLVGGLR